MLPFDCVMLISLWIARKSPSASLPSSAACAGDLLPPRNTGKPTGQNLKRKTCSKLVIFDVPQQTKPNKHCVHRQQERCQLETANFKEEQQTRLQMKGELHRQVR
jgi:hypothetical protein